MKCQSIWKFFCPTTLCSLFYGYVEECCVIPPWTKASERYVSFFNQEGGIGIFGFGVLAIFSSVFRFCCSFRFADFTQFSIWFTWPDPWSSLWSDPIRSDPNFVDAAGELFYCFVASVDRQTPQMVGCASSDFILLYATMTTKQNQYWENVSCIYRVFSSSKWFVRR